MPRAAIWSAALLVVAGALYALSVALTSDETRIRRRIEAMVEGFNHPDVGDTTAPLAEDFEVLDRRGRRVATREEVVQFLRWLVLSKKDPKQGGFGLRAEIVPESLSITVSEDRSAAESSLRVRFEALSGGEAVESGEVTVETRWIRGEGWILHRATHERGVGKLPF